MRRIQLTAIAARFAALFCVVASAGAVPYEPKDGKQIVEHLPSRNDPAQREFQRLRKLLATTPDNIDVASELAQKYINEGRNDGDPRYLGYAQAVLAPWWAQAEPPVKVRVLRATLLQSTHQFPAALKDLNAVLKQDRGNAQAWLTRATVLQVQGQYALAKNSCMHLYALAPELVTVTCLSNVANLNRDAAQSYALLMDAYQREPAADPGIQIWVMTLLAEMSARRGDVVAAEQWYRQAMALAPPDSYLLGSYSDFLLDRKRATEVVLLLKDKTRVDALLLRYALALQATGSAAAKEQRIALGQRFDAAMMRGDTVHQREQARYELQLNDNAAAALKLAQLNWEVQKEAADVRIYLEAAVAANNRQAAAPVIAWIKQNGLQDAALTPLIARLTANGNA
ncbi:tetratricopeptide repeat protein [Undibacterium sp.]|uniref:tetratricopeptide repeat protein n=1 Tax=Undibacterium sp. TaxID=1914977 RepID=UPI00374D772B